MGARSIRNRLSESNNIWPGFVDVLATLLIVIIFVLMVFTVSQIYLNDALTGRDKALQDLRNQINELSKILILETKEKEKALQNLSQTESDLLLEKQTTGKLELQAEKDRTTISSQDLNISLLSGQIDQLLTELKIVAKALETYEGLDITQIQTEGLGERINKALATKIDQLNETNRELELSRKELAIKVEQLNTTNKELELSKLETENQLNVVKDLTYKLSANEIQLQDQIVQYQKLTNDLIAINESLGLEDADLIEQLEAIKNKNIALENLNQDLIQKDATIFDLRGKIEELNNILSINEVSKSNQELKISDLNKQIEVLKQDNKLAEDSSILSLQESEKKAQTAFEQINVLSNEIENLQKEISLLNAALESSEQDILTKELQIEVLGERLNKALTSKVFELQKYRSEFFGRLKSILGDRSDIKIVGDRFIFESELLFNSGSAVLQKEGEKKLKEIGLTLKEITTNIPKDIDWIIQVEGHTDKNPINTAQFPSNWELSSARANSVLKLLIDLGFAPQRLSAAGYGEFYPISIGETQRDFQQNRRIELKLTSR